ncbi:MAG TPA: cyclic nucleotide-binding domain-containing protein [Myxococcales bacterium]|nr:cyclic nucleotide-binding domain-containing protein [Myxococcales bacterium]
MNLRTFLTNLPSFSGFSPEEIATLEGVLRVANYPEGHAFTHQGELSDAMYILLDGSVRVTEEDEIAGLSREVKELHAGELFGLLSLISHLPAVTTCTATSQVSAAALPREDFDRLVHDAPQLGHHLHYMVAVQLARDLQNRNRSMRELLKREAATVEAR